MMRRLNELLGFLLLGVCFLLAGCGSSAQQSASDFSDWKPTGSMELQYADQFSVDYYDGGYALITIAKQNRYLLVPEGKQAPQGLSSSGCGYAVSLYRNFDAALGLLRSSGLISGKIFSRADGGEYKELAR